jgi:hypothetical protein
MGQNCQSRACNNANARVTATIRNRSRRSAMGTINTLGAMSKSAMIASQILERANSHVV